MLKGAQGGRRRSNPHICKSSFSKYLSQWRGHWLPCPVYVVVHVVRVDSKACYIVDQNLPCHIPEWAECWELWFFCSFFWVFTFYFLLKFSFTSHQSTRVCQVWLRETLEYWEQRRGASLAADSSKLEPGFNIFPRWSPHFSAVQIEGSRYTNRKVPWFM